MNWKTLTSYASIILLVLPSLALAQNPSGAISDWSAVRSVSPGEKLSVRLKDGKKMEGRLLSVSDAMLTMDRGNRSTDIDRQAVEKVYRLVPKSVGKAVGKSALIGAGIGFGAGAIVGVSAGSYEDLETAGLVGILGGLGAAIGAGIGAIVGGISGSGDKKVMIYDAK